MSQFYVIRSKLTGFVLTADEGGFRPKAKVTPHDQNGQDSQIFYDDQSTGTIRVKSSNFCLDIEDGKLVVCPYQPGDRNQQWVRSDQHIRNRQDSNQVLDVYDNSRERGTKVGQYHFNGGANQCWSFENTGGYAPIGGAPAMGGSMYPSYPSGPGGYPPAPGGFPGQPPHGHHGHHDHHGHHGHGGPGGYPPAGGYPAAPGYAPAQPYFQKREFFIVSDMNGKVLDISGNDRNPGAKVIMFDKKMPPCKNQLWYMDERGFVKSSFNDFCFCNHEYGKALTMQPFAESPRHQWRVEGERISNGAGERLDISGANNNNCAEVISYKDNQKKNQKWRLDYI